MSFIVPIFAWNVPLISLIFLKRSLVFPILLFSSISLHWSLRKVFLSLLAILWNSAFKWVYLYFSPLPFASLLFTAICKASSDNHFAFLHFFFLGMVLIPDKTGSAGEGNGKPPQYSCLENPINSMKKKKDKTLKHELLWLEGAQYATGDQWRTPERMKRWSQRKNDAQLWMWLVMEVKSDAVKSHIA